MLDIISIVVNFDEQCYLITREIVTEVVEHKATYEEADTEMVIHVMQVAPRYRKVIVVADDMEIFIILLRLHS